MHKITDMGTESLVPMSVILFICLLGGFSVFFRPFFLTFFGSGGESVPSAFCRFNSASSVFISMISFWSFASHSSRYGRRPCGCIFCRRSRRGSSGLPTGSAPPARCTRYPACAACAGQAGSRLYRTFCSGRGQHSAPTQSRSQTARPCRCHSRCWRSLPLYIVGNVGVDVQRGRRRHMV